MSGIRIKKLESSSVRVGSSGIETTDGVSLDFEHDANSNHRIFIRVKDPRGAVAYGYIPAACVKSVRDFLTEQLGPDVQAPCERY